MAVRKPNRNNLRSLFNGEVLRNVFGDRTRTNLLKKQEEMAISWLVQRIPSFITSNMLTGIGFFGNMIVCASFVLASFFSRSFLLLGLLGFAISWFGDSLVTEGLPTSGTSREENTDLLLISQLTG